MKVKEMLLYPIPPYTLNVEFSIKIPVSPEISENYTFLQCVEIIIHAVSNSSHRISYIIMYTSDV